MDVVLRRTFCWKSLRRGRAGLSFTCTIAEHDALIIRLIEMERLHYAYLDAVDEGQARFRDVVKLHQQWTQLNAHIFRILHAYGVLKDVAGGWLEDELELYRYRWMYDRQPWRVIPSHPCYDATGVGSLIEEITGREEKERCALPSL
jgi:hypothetical protein